MLFVFYIYYLIVYVFLLLNNIKIKIVGWYP